MVLPLLLKLPIVSTLVRPFTAHFVGGPWSPSLPILHWPILVRSFTMGLMTVMNWEFAESLFDAYVPQVMFLFIMANQNSKVFTSLSKLEFLLQILM